MECSDLVAVQSDVTELAQLMSNMEVGTWQIAGLTVNILKKWAGSMRDQQLYQLTVHIEVTDRHPQWALADKQAWIVNICPVVKELQPQHG